MQFDHLPLFQVTYTESEEYGEWVKKTATLVGRPYMVVHKIFEREQWSTDEIRRTYIIATKHSNCEPCIAWWAIRKRRNGQSM